MSTYLGYTVLDTKIHNRRERATGETFARGLRELDPVTTKRYADVVTVAPAPVRPFLWTCFSRPEITAMLAFLDERKGRAIPFWLPSYQQDLTLNDDLAQSASSATINWIGYTLHQFAGSGARRHLAFYAVGGGTMFFAKVTNATDPNNGVTESLALGTPASRLFPATSTIVSFLKLCRLDDDTAQWTWRSRDHAEAVLQFRELPLEAAA